ncbi:MAG: ATP-binding protein [Planctomycetota bacterium]|jgi:signal transduction histidine kinase/HAMP domain-containing protein
MSIKTKILFWFLFPTILISAATAVLCYYYTHNTIKQNIFAQLEMAADELETRVHTFLHDKRMRTVDFSSDGLISDCTEEITMRESRKEYHTAALNAHLTANKKSLDANIYEVFILDLNGKVIASTNENHIGKDESKEIYFTRAEPLKAFVSPPPYGPLVRSNVIAFSTVLLSKNERKPIGIIVNKIMMDYKWDGDYEQDYALLTAVNKTRIIDFSSDGFIRDSTEGITWRKVRSRYYANRLNAHLVNNKMPLDPDIIELFITDLNGSIISSTKEGQTGRDVSDERFFSQTTRKGYCISDLHYTPLFRQNTYEIAKLLTNKRGLKSIGMLVGRYSGDSLKRITRSGTSVDLSGENRLEGLGETGELYIVNSHKLMITESRFIGDTILKLKVDTEGVVTAFDNGVGMVGIYPDYRDIPILGVSRYIEEMDWVVLAEKDVSEAFAPIAGLRNIVLTMGVIGIAAIVVIAVVISTGITRPINRLIEGTKRIAGGDLENPIALGKKRDELNELGESFNLMMKELGDASAENKQLFLLVKRGRDEWLKTFDAITDIITIHDKEFKILRANNSFYEKFNIDKGQLPDKRCYEIFHNTDSPLRSCPLDKSIKSLKPEIEEIDDPNMGGVFLVSVYPLEDEKGEVYGFVHLAKDITFQKKVERQLVENAKELKTANTELESFVYIVSHDLKEPLFAIEGYTSRLLKTHKDAIDDKGKFYINRTKVNIEKMSQKIQEIMDVLKVGRVTYNFKDKDSGVIVREVVNALESKIAKHRINVSIQDNLPIVLCDEKRMRDVLSNLITNAIKFMGEDKQRQIKIGYDRSGDYYKFFVEDTGIGIREEYKEQIFKIFKRLNEVETEGTGVGLAIVKKIVEQHKGRIWIEGPVKDGRGSRFCFTIPVTREA